MNVQRFLIGGLAVLAGLMVGRTLGLNRVLGGFMRAA